MIELPKRDGTMYTIDSMVLAKMKADYPKIDVEGELKKMRNWLDANPRSLKRDVYRFVINWLNRAKPMASGGSVTRETSQHYAVVSERMRKPAEPVRYAPPEVAQAHISDLRKMLGMRRQQA